jgi:hypothetical protein
MILTYLRIQAHPRPVLVDSLYQRQVGRGEERHDPQKDLFVTKDRGRHTG